MIDFRMVVLKGLVETGRASAYFGSTLALASHVDGAEQCGWVCRLGDELVPTDQGMDAYVELGLYDLPDSGRAYGWDWSNIPRWP